MSDWTPGELTRCKENEVKPCPFCVGDMCIAIKSRNISKHGTKILRQSENNSLAAYLYGRKRGNEYENRRY